MCVCCIAKYLFRQQVQEILLAQLIQLRKYFAKKKFMLTKNVYLMYHPGYSGSYVSWAIHMSDLDNREHTVKDPINTTVSAQYGGIGTSHHHVRIPTHIGYNYLVNWMLLNRPTKPKVYIVNSANRTYPCPVDTNSSIAHILRHDRDGIIIPINNANDWKISSYGFINGVIKWPTRLAAESKLRDFKLPFDVFDCADNQRARNWFVASDENLKAGWPVNFDIVKHEVKTYLDWYHCRNDFQPHEVNADNFIDQIDLTDRIFELDCRTIATEGFIPCFADIMNRAKISDRFDLDYVAQYHHKYCSAQQHLQWFESIDQWEQTGQLDDYLLSHSCIQACVVYRILSRLNVEQAANRNYEMIDFLDRPLDETVLEKLIALHNNWKSMSTQNINHVYQDLTQPILLGAITN